MQARGDLGQTIWGVQLPLRGAGHLVRGEARSQPDITVPGGPRGPTGFGRGP